MASLKGEQHITLAPGTLVLVLFDRYPYWPSVVLSRRAAHDQPALRAQLEVNENNKRLVCAVRFLGANTCAVVSVSAVEPLIANDEKYRSWVWRSSVEYQERVQWPPFGEDLERDWSRAYDEADVFAVSSSHRTSASPCIASRGAGIRAREKNEKQVGYLPPGTILWLCLLDAPIWPARVCELTKEVHEQLRVEAEEDATEPLLFFNDPDQTTPIYSSLHSCCAFTSDQFWQNHMRERTMAMAKEESPNPKRIARKIWLQWEEACDEAYAACGALDVRLS